MNPMNFLLGVMGSGSFAFVGLSAYAVMETRRVSSQPHDIVKPVEVPIEVAAVQETPAVAVVVPEPVPIPVPVVEEVPVAAEEPPAASPALVMGYWPIRGLAGPLRMILEYSGVEYEDRQHDPEDWFGKTKPELLKANALANLPYVKEGDRCLFQSNACLLYLGAKLGLDPTDILDPKAITNLQVLNEATDLRMSLVSVVYPGRKVSRTQEEFEANRTELLTQRVPQSYAKLEAHLQQTGTAFFSADTPMSADFHMWETLDQHEALARAAGADSPLAAYPKLQDYYTNFRQLPQLEKYFTSDAYGLPLNSVRAKPWFY